MILPLIRIESFVGKGGREMFKTLTGMTVVLMLLSLGAIPPAWSGSILQEVGKSREAERIRKATREKQDALIKVGEEFLFCDLIQMYPPRTECAELVEELLKDPIAVALLKKLTPYYRTARMTTDKDAPYIALTPWGELKLSHRAFPEDVREFFSGSGFPPFGSGDSGFMWFLGLLPSEVYPDAHIRFGAAAYSARMANFVRTAKEIEQKYGARSEKVRNAEKNLKSQGIECMRGDLETREQCLLIGNALLADEATREVIVGLSATGVHLVIARWHPISAYGVSTEEVNIPLEATLEEIKRFLLEGKTE